MIFKVICNTHGTIDDVFIPEGFAIETWNNPCPACSSLTILRPHDVIRIIKGVGEYADDRHDRLMFWCPGCKDNHAVTRSWGWNGSLERPTFKSSVRCTNGDPSYCCHSQVTDGQIRFYEDSSHELRGQTRPLEPWPDEQERQSES
jgi:hypothetical protein